MKQTNDKRISTSILNKQKKQLNAVFVYLNKILEEG